MNEFKILIRHFIRFASHPFRSPPRYHEIGGSAALIVHNQISRSDRNVNVSRLAGALLNLDAKLSVHAGPEAATVDKATHERAFEGEKRDE
jgi:hypothetical protein